MAGTDARQAAALARLLRPRVASGVRASGVVRARSRSMAGDARGPAARRSAHRATRLGSSVGRFRCCSARRRRGGPRPVHRLSVARGEEALQRQLDGRGHALATGRPPSGDLRRERDAAANASGHEGLRDAASGDRAMLACVGRKRCRRTPGLRARSVRYRRGLARLSYTATRRPRGRGGPRGAFNGRV